MGMKVSICVPVYHGAVFVRDTLSAIQKQSHRDLEVLISVALPGFKWAKEPDRVSHSGSRWR